MNPLTTGLSTLDIRVFQAMPGNSALLLPNDPLFTVLAVTDSFCQTSGQARAALVGKGLFEAFPNSPDDPAQASEKRLRASLELVVATKKTNSLPIHRYDIPRSDGTFEERYWSAVNKPVCSESGELLYIIHSAEDVTFKIKEGQREEAFSSQEKAYRELMNAPMLMCILEGAEHTIRLANENTLDIWGRTAEVVGMPLLHVLPELKSQGFIERINEVKKKNRALHLYEMPLILDRQGKKEKFYFDFILQPYYENEGDLAPTGVICLAHNVTEQVRTRQRFKNVVEQSPDPILILMGEDLVLEVANQALFELWQVGPEALNKPFLEILPEMKDQVFGELLRNVLHTGEPFHGNEVPALFRRKNGIEETRYVNFSYQAYREADGSISGVLVIATDVTGQVLAKQKLLESERNLRNTILQSPVAMCILKGPEFVVEVANERIYELWGKSEEEMLDRPVFEGLPEARNQGLEELLQHVYTTGERFTANERPVSLPRHGGVETVYINFVYEPFREGDGTISGIIAVAIDVTEQVLARKKVEESEEQFSTLANSIVQLAWSADADGWIYWYNDRWFDYTGTTLEEMKGWGWEKVHHPDHIDRVVAFAKEAWPKGEPWELIFPLRRHDGEYRWFLTRGAPVKNKEGKVVRWIGTNTDIDDQKQAEALLEQRVQERTRELELRNKELEQFTYVSHHDLQEPLRKIIMFADMVKEESLDLLSATSRKRLDKVSDAARRMSAALKDVLNYASLNREELFTETDLDEVMSIVQTDLELVIMEKSATIHSDHLPVLRAVPQQMHQLFYNLVNNALKFSRPAQPPIVHIECGKLLPHELKKHNDLAQDRTYYLITVRDNGIGFRQDLADRIFGMFQRLHSKDQYAGTGIGLALCRKVVLNHGGKIWGESKEGEGAVFRIILPG
ncbi:MAG TPA: PAS domain-containing protein [Flavisolibacter sp.]